MSVRRGAAEQNCSIPAEISTHLTHIFHDMHVLSAELKVLIIALNGMFSVEDINFSSQSFNVNDYLLRQHRCSNSDIWSAKAAVHHCCELVQAGRQVAIAELINPMSDHFLELVE